jgi:hypothetical protein
MKPYSIKKRGKYWHYDINIDGKRYRGSTGATSREMAMRYVNTKQKRQGQACPFDKISSGNRKKSII